MNRMHETQKCKKRNLAKNVTTSRDVETAITRKFAKKVGKAANALNAPNPKNAEK